MKLTDRSTVHYSHSIRLFMLSITHTDNRHIPLVSRAASFCPHREIASFRFDDSRNHKTGFCPAVWQAIMETGAKGPIDYKPEGRVGDQPFSINLKKIKVGLIFVALSERTLKLFEKTWADQYDCLMTQRPHFDVLVWVSRVGMQWNRDDQLMPLVLATAISRS